jgi:hypothetical protein
MIWWFRNKELLLYSKSLTILGQRHQILEICLPSGYGQYKVGIKYRGKLITALTNNMQAVDDYKSEDGEKDGRVLRRKRGYECLRNEIIIKNI